MNPIYILGAGNFAQEVYSEVFLQGDASKYGKFEGYIYLSKLNNPILIDEEMKKSVGRCHVLWGRQLPAYDTMYYLNILDYGQLQRMYKCGSG